jgi:hypothetical protein
MNVVKILWDVRDVMSKGYAVRSSGILTNIEAGASALYALLSAVFLLIDDLGIPVHLGATDMHTVANGWSITAATFYSIYRVVTNPHAGFSLSFSKDAG